MNDYAYLNATDVRKNFSETINNALYTKPQLIKRNSNDVILMGKDLVYELLDNLRINLIINKDKNTYYTENDVLEDIIGWGGSKQEAIDDFLNMLDAYAHDYYDNFQVYSKTKRGKKDLPYVFRVICSSGLEDLRSIVICQDGKN